MQGERTEPANTGLPKTIVVKKEVVPFEQESPVEEPLFVNHCQVVHHEGTIYIDVGVIPLDDILSTDGESGIRFIVLNRLVMSIPTFKGLQHQINSLAKELGG